MQTGIEVVLTIVGLVYVAWLVYRYDTKPQVVKSIELLVAPAVSYAVAWISSEFSLFDVTVLYVVIAAVAITFLIIRLIFKVIDRNVIKAE